MTSPVKKIFYQDSGYPIKRNLLEIPFRNYKPVKKIGLLKIFNHIHYKLKDVNPLLSNTHWELMKKKNGIWHFFNGVSFGKTPWVVTFETTVPRWHGSSKSIQEYGVKALASDNCKRLIALSKCAKNLQIRYLEDEFPSYKSQIIPKISVVHPPQKLLVNSIDEKMTPENKLVFTLIGADFFRKGGREVLQVYDRLSKSSLPIQLNIVSTLQFGDYATKTTSEDLKRTKKIIKKYPNQIQHYEGLPNEKVLELLKNSHVGLLPTWGDTYGYSILEAQACGCPVITTNIRALPEINNEDLGWVIEVPKDQLGNAKVSTPEERTEFSDILKDSLYEIISGIISHPDQIKKKGRACIDRIREEHSPKNVAEKLEQIYEKGL